MRVCVFVCLSVCVYVCLSMCLCMGVFVCLCTYFFGFYFGFLSLCMRVYFFVFLCVRVCLFLCGCVLSFYPCLSAFVCCLVVCVCVVARVCLSYPDVASLAWKFSSVRYGSCTTECSSQWTAVVQSTRFFGICYCYCCYCCFCGSLDGQNLVVVHSIVIVDFCL